MATSRRGPRAKGRGRQDFDTLLKIFIDNPNRAFYPDEIVKEVLRQDESISEPRIEYVRKELFASGHIRFDAPGGPHRKRYKYTGHKWEPTPSLPQPMVPRLCDPVTLAQWRELWRELTAVSQLAQCALDGDETASFPLHDALEESGVPRLADHFSAGRVHNKCWVLKVLAGKVSLDKLTLSSKHAAGWLKRVFAKAVSPQDQLGFSRDNMSLIIAT